MYHLHTLLLCLLHRGHAFERAQSEKLRLPGR